MERNNAFPVKWSSVAKNRLLEVYVYIESKTSAQVAEKVSLELADAAESIGQNPYLYSECRELPTKTKSYRNYIKWNYRIIFKILRDFVLILDIFHCKRNPKELTRLRRIKS